MRIFSQILACAKNRVGQQEKVKKRKHANNTSKKIPKIIGDFSMN